MNHGVINTTSDVVHPNDGNTILSIFVDVGWIV